MVLVWRPCCLCSAPTSLKPERMPLSCFLAVDNLEHEVPRMDTLAGITIKFRFKVEIMAMAMDLYLNCSLEPPASRTHCSAKEMPPSSRTEKRSWRWSEEIAVVAFFLYFSVV